MATALDEARLLMRKLYLSTNINFNVYINPLRQKKIHLKQMLKRYEQWRKVIKYYKNCVNIGTEKKRFDEFERYIVHFLLEICFWMSYGYSDVVSGLLIIFHETDGNFEELFCATPVTLLDSKKYGLEDLDKIVRNPWSREGMIEDPLTENMEFVERPKERMKYFIKHAFENKLLFLRFGEHWLRYKMKTNPAPTNVMTRNSLLFTDPDILMKFLEHGLLANADRHDEYVVRLLNDFFNILEYEILNTESLNLSHSTTKAQEVVSVLLRAVRSTEFSVLFQRNPNNVILECIQRLIPNKEPLKLRYLCRWQIRKQLCDCGQLPDGISFLPIPKILQQYLHCRSD